MKSLARALLLVLCAGLLLQLFFVLRIALMVVVDPESTAFQRSEAWQMLRSSEGLHWSQQWLPYDRIARRGRTTDRRQRPPAAPPPPSSGQGPGGCGATGPGGEGAGNGCCPGGWKCC